MTNKDRKPFLKKIKSALRNAKNSIFKDKSIALIRIEGVIIDSQNFPMAKKIIRALKEVEEREFKALVLRINSPGGTVGASQEIHDAILRVKEKGIKVIASYGEVSASGGVYVGSAADKIVANPGTITGSIGVIIGTSNFKKLYEKIGIDSEVIKSGPYKDILSSKRYLTEEEKQILQEMIDNSYNQFVDVVAKGRHLSTEEVKSFADGRIFTGEQALELGLIDKVGSLKEAVYYAAELVDIEGEPKVINMSPKKPVFGHMLSSKLQNLEMMSEYSGMPMWLMQNYL